MAFDWREFLDVANALQQQAAGASNDEALLRTAVSRCYFGAFCRARDYAALRLKFAATAKPEDHGRLIALLTSRTKFSGIAVKLRELRQYRNEADYDGESAAQWTVVAAAAQQRAASVFAALGKS